MIASESIHSRSSRHGVEAIRVAHVVHGLSRGGLENGVINVVNGLSGRGFQQSIYCLDKPGEMADRIEETPVHVLDRKRHDVLLPLRLGMMFREFRPNIIHCRNWNTWLDAALALSLSGRKSALVWSFHGFENSDSMPSRRRIASRILARKTSRLLAVCRDSAHRYSRASGIPAAAFDIIYNGVDCNRFHPAENRLQARKTFGYEDGELVILTVASLTKIKDHSSLIKASAIALQRTDSNLRFVFVGEGSERAKLEQEISELGLGSHVHLLGPSDRVQDHLAAADIFVLPSELEGMSNAILEAMASGLPIISNSVGGNVELVEHEESGLLTEYGNIESMANAIKLLADNESQRKIMGRNARQRVEKMFSIEAMLDRYARFYQDIVKGSTA